MSVSRIGTVQLPELPGSEVAWLDCVVFAPVNGHGVWGAIREARVKLRNLPLNGLPRMIFLRAVEEGGGTVSLLDPSANAVMVGYTFEAA